MCIPRLQSFEMQNTGEGANGELLSAESKEGAKLYFLFIITVCILTYANICKYVLVLVLIYILIPI